MPVPPIPTKPQGASCGYPESLGKAPVTRDAAYVKAVTEAGGAAGRAPASMLLCGATSAFRNEATHPREP